MTSVLTPRDRLAEIRSGTHAIVDLDRYIANLRLLTARAGAGRELVAVVKANAYGHGAVACAHAAVDAGCAYLAVARIDEALELRAGGVAAPILVIGPPNRAQVDVALDNQIALTVATEASLERVLDAAQRRSEPAVIHLKIDTGLRRYGALPPLARKLAQTVERSPNAVLEGIYTHFSSADEEETAPTDAQLDIFQRSVRELRDAGIQPRYVHCANSAAILANLHPETNLVRAGIASYGLDPSDEVPVDDGYRQILTVRSVLTRRFTLGRGESVSYNRTYTAAEDEAAAAVPIGYADGIERHLSNRGWFVHADGGCPIIGRVCMDQTVVRVPESAREGDALTIVSDGRDGAMTVAQLGELCGTNTYEPVTRLAARVPRLYLRSGAPSSWAIPILGQSGHF